MSCPEARGFCGSGVASSCLLAGLDADQLKGAGLEFGRGGQPGVGVGAFADPDGVAAEGAEVFDQVLEAVGGVAVGGAVALVLSLGGLGAAGGRDRDGWGQGRLDGLEQRRESGLQHEQEVVGEQEHEEDRLHAF